MSTSQEQMRRLLAMIPYLQARPGVPVPEVAQAFSISPKQVVSDLNLLWMCGLPGGMPDDLIEVDMEAVEGEGVIHLSNADYLDRPLRFTRDEAVSLVVALSTVSELAAGEVQDAALSAAAKLSAVTGHEDPVWLGMRTGDEQIREELVAAIEQGRRVRLTYDGATRGETTQPDVDPAEIQLRDSVAYLQGWSLDRQAWRTYRLDRIAAVEMTGEPAEAHGAVPELAEGWFDASDGSVTLELAPAAAWVVEYHPVREVRRPERPDRPTVATFTVADPLWLQALLLRLGEAARVVAPIDAADSAARAASEAIELTEEVCGRAQ